MTWSRVRRVGPPLLGVLIIAFGVLLVYRVAHDRAPVGTAQHFWYVCLAAVLGALVATSELVSRYRDEPMSAIISIPAFVYLAMNAAVSASVYGLLVYYRDSLIPSLSGDQLLTAIIAGFGAMAVLRSKFFTLRTEKGEDIAVGPDAAVSAFLAAADRGVDRTRAARRLELVFTSASSIETPEKARDFMEVALGAFQNLSKQEKTELVAYFKSVSELPYPDDLKLQAMSYYILGITGEHNFNRVMSNLENYARTSPTTGSGIDGQSVTPAT